MESIQSTHEIDYFRVQALVRGGIRSVSDLLIQALASEEFGIMTRVEFASIQGKDEQGSRRAMIICCCFPRDQLAESYMGGIRDRVIRCSGIVQEQGDGTVRVELSRPVRLLHMDSHRIVRLIGEVDQRLYSVLSRFECG